MANLSTGTAYNFLIDLVVPKKEWLGESEQK